MLIKFFPNGKGAGAGPSGYLVAERVLAYDGNRDLIRNAEARSTTRLQAQLESIAACATLLIHVNAGVAWLAEQYAVIVNEFGEEGIYNDLVVDADEEVFEMNNGCVCRTVRGDLIRILGDLIKCADKFDAITVETTVLADPAPVAQTFFVDQDVTNSRCRSPLRPSIAFVSMTTLCEPGAD